MVDARSREAEEPDVVRLRIPAPLQVVMALDLAVAVVVASLAFLVGLSAMGDADALGSYAPFLGACGLYAAAGVCLSVWLGRGSSWARIAQVPWSALALYLMLGSGPAGEPYPTRGPLLLLLVQTFFLLVPAVSLVLPFLPPSQRFFTALRGARARD